MQSQPPGSKPEALLTAFLWLPPPGVSAGGDYILKGTWKKRVSAERLGGQQGDDCWGLGAVVRLCGPFRGTTAPGPCPALTMDFWWRKAKCEGGRKAGGLCPPRNRPPLPPPPQPLGPSQGPGGRRLTRSPLPFSAPRARA